MTRTPRSGKSKGATKVSNLQREFQNFKRELETGNTIDERNNTQRDNTEFDSLVTSPN